MNISFLIWLGISKIEKQYNIFFKSLDRERFVSEEKELSKLKNKSAILSKIKFYAKQDIEVNEIINKLVNVDKKDLQETLLSLSKEISLAINKNSSDISVEFLDVKNKFSEIKQSVKGVYIFLLKITSDDRNSFLEFKTKWNIFKENEKVPKINEYSFEFYETGVNSVKINNENFAVLYVGKSQKINSRLKEHLGEGNNGSYSMRLKSFLNTDSNNDYEIKYCYLSTEDSYIIPVLDKIEKSLHLKYKPLLGNK